MVNDKIFWPKDFVELGGGVDDMPRWCRDGVCVELGFR